MCIRDRLDLDTLVRAEFEPASTGVTVTDVLSKKLYNRHTLTWLVYSAARHLGLEAKMISAQSEDHYHIQVGSNQHNHFEWKVGHIVDNSIL